MASNLACVGLGVESEDDLLALVNSVLPHATLLGRADGTDVVRWEDPSGVRLVVGVSPQGVVDLLPSFAGTARLRLHGLRMVNDEVAVAAVVDDDGEQLTSMAVEVEQRRLLVADQPLDVDASIVALGNAVTVFRDSEDFERSDASLLSPESRDEEPPPHVAERGLKWPPRVAAESFFSYGVFQDPGEAEASARLSGTVVAAEARQVSHTGNGIIVAHVRGPGFDVTLCLDHGEHPEVPPAGAVVAGTVFLTADLHDRAPRRRGILGRLGRRSSA